MDRDTEHSRSARGYPHGLRKVQLTQDEPEEKVVPGQDRDCEVRLSEDSGHLANEK